MPSGGGARPTPAGDRLYYGLVDSVLADGCSGGCVAGIGYISSSFSVAKTSAGFAGFPGSTDGRNEASSTFTHEMGHNFGSHHAPEDGAAGALFPYSYALKDPARGFRRSVADEPPVCSGGARYPADVHDGCRAG